MFIIQCPILWYPKVCALPSAHSSSTYLSNWCLASVICAFLFPVSRSSRHHHTGQCALGPEQYTCHDMVAWHPRAMARVYVENALRTDFLLLQYREWPLGKIGIYRVLVVPSMPFGAETVNKGAFSKYWTVFKNAILMNMSRRSQELTINTALP